MAPGKLYHKDEFIFGEAFIRAWKGEQGLTNGPLRIVLDPELAREAPLNAASVEAHPGISERLTAARYSHGMEPSFIPKQLTSTA
jgi:hypothetical protein